MPWLHLLLAQAAAPAAAAAAPPAVEFDLADVEAPSRTQKDRCPTEQTSDIVVCARRGLLDKHRLRSVTDFGEPEPVRAEIDLGGGIRGDAHLEQVEIGPGLVSNRVMVRLKVPF